MKRFVPNRRLGLTFSMILHGLACALIFAPMGTQVATSTLAKTGTIVPLFVPAKTVATSSTTTTGHCSFGPCTGGPQKPAVSTVRLDAPELQFLDDSTHELLPALTRVGGAIAIALTSDRTRTLSVYRASDGASASGSTVSQFPLRVVVYDPGAYVEIVAEIRRLGVDTGSVRVLGVFPAESQARLYRAIDAEAARQHLPPGRRRAIVAVSALSPFGIEVRAVSVAPQEIGFARRAVTSQSGTVLKRLAFGGRVPLHTYSFDIIKHADSTDTMVQYDARSTNVGIASLSFLDYEHSSSGFRNS
jgi:hypothetical protein